MRLFAYADDLAAVVPDIWHWLRLAAPVFDLLIAATSLKIKPRKTNIIPLWSNPQLFNMKRRVSTIIPSWAGVEITVAAKYLGILVGPDVSMQDRWAACLVKFDSRVRVISALGLGGVTLTRRFNQVVGSLLSYLSQLAQLPPDFHNHLSITISRVFRLPHQRIPAWVFCNLKT